MPPFIVTSEIDRGKWIRASAAEFLLVDPQPQGRVRDEILQLDVHFSNIVDNMILSTFKIALHLILTYIINFQPDKSGANKENDKITQVVDYIDHHLTAIDSLESLCGALHMSKSALSKLFTSEMGVSVMRYIRYKKCVTARALLQKGVPPTTACGEAGFNDYSSFYRMYTRIYKHAPSQGKWTLPAIEETENRKNSQPDQIGPE